MSIIWYFAALKDEYILYYITCIHKFHCSVHSYDNQSFYNCTLFSHKSPSFTGRYTFFEAFPVLTMNVWIAYSIDFVGYILKLQIGVLYILGDDAAIICWSY